jgi:methylthioribose-1-phosphate isomerase
VAILAREHGIPFYVAAPCSTIDPLIKGGADIPIEERDISEVTHLGGKRVAAAGITVLNPAFDVTPNAYITAILTDQGILKAPYKLSIAKALKKNK